MWSNMYTQPIILPLNIDGTIFALHDREGRIIGTGTREVCEVLVHIMNSQASARVVNDTTRKTAPRSNVRAAIVI